MKKVILILLPLLFSTACLDIDRQPVDNISSIPVKTDLVIAAKEDEKPSFNCEIDRLDPSKELRRDSYFNDEKIIHYDCKLDTYCIKMDHYNLGEVCWPYLDRKNDFDEYAMETHTFDDQLKLIYSRKVFAAIETDDPYLYSGKYRQDYPLTISFFEGRGDILYKF